MFRILLKNVFGARHQFGPFLNQIVGTAGTISINLSRYGKYIPVLFRCASGRDQRTAFFSRFNNQYALTEPGNNPISSWEIIRSGSLPGQVFTDNTTVADDLLIQRFI